MKRLILFIASFTLAGMSTRATAQTIGIAPVEAEAGSQTELIVTAEGLGSDVTALQFNLSVPEGITLDVQAITKGSAASEHTLSISELDNGDLLIVLYSMDMTTLTNGELLRLPITTGNESLCSTVRFYTIRISTIEAVSIALSEVSADITVTTSEPQPAVTDEQYASAIASIEVDSQYYIYTTSNGTSEGTQRYYLTSSGYLTADPAEAYVFTFHQRTGEELFRSPGWKLDACFSNPHLSNGATGDLIPQGHIRTDTGNNRDTWEGQVWYKGDNGCYAVRATNIDSDTYGAATFWTVLDTDSNGTPEADYSWTPNYVWQLASPLPPQLEGDVNRDGSITIADVTALVNIILGK